MIYIVLVLTVLCAVLLFVLLAQRRRISDDVYSAVAHVAHATGYRIAHLCHLL